MSPNIRLAVRLFLPFFAIHCMEQVYFIFGTPLKQYALSPETIGWILSCYFVAIMSIRPIGGWLLEYFGIRRTLIGAGILGFIGCSVLFFARGVPFLILGRVLSGMSFGVYGVGLFSYQALAIPASARGTTMSLVTSGGILPMAIITPIGEWFLRNGMQSAYLALGPLCALLCIYLGSRVGVGEEVPAHKEPTWGRYADLPAHRSYLVLLVSGALMALLDAFVVSISIFAGEYDLIASYFLTSSAIAATFVRIAGSRPLGALPCALVLSPSGLCMGLGLLMVSFFPTNAVLLAGGIIFGVGIGAGWPVYVRFVADILPAALRPKGTAVALLVYDSGWIVTPLIVGYCASLVGTVWAFRLLSVLGMTAICATFVLYWLPLNKRSARA